MVGSGDLGEFERFFGRLQAESGEPLRLEPFQKTILRDYFDGIIESLILLPKKNGKTSLLAGLALFHVTTKPDAECVIGAASREQASILYKQAVGFVDRSGGLNGRVVAKQGYREIRAPQIGGRMRVLAADADTADGVIPTLALVDELHRHKSADLYGVFRDGLGPRHGQMVTISTAGDHELSPLGLMRLQARKLPGVRDGKHLHIRAGDGSFAMHEWSLDDSDDVDNLEVVKQANPASWQTVEALALRHNSPSMVPWHWARFACGIWVGAEGWWVRPDDWHAAGVLGARFERGDRIALGFDGSRHGDATGIVGCRLDDGLLVPLGVWEAPRGVAEWDVPTSEVDAAVANAMEHFQVVRGYFDPPLWQTEIDAWAREYGDPAVARYPTNRSRFMQAAERFRTDLLEGHVHHGGDERLTRHVLNAQVREARGGYWLDKPVAGDKIDLAVAAVLAYEARCDALAAGGDRTGFVFL